MARVGPGSNQRGRRINRGAALEELNTGRGVMKRIMEEAVARNAKAIHYWVSAGIRVGAEKGIGSVSGAIF